MAAGIVSVLDVLLAMAGGGATAGRLGRLVYSLAIAGIRGAIPAAVQVSGAQREHLTRMEGAKNIFILISFFLSFFLLMYSLYIIYFKKEAKWD